MKEPRTDEQIVEEFRKLSINDRERAADNGWLRTTLAAVREEERERNDAYITSLNLHIAVLEDQLNALTPPNQDDNGADK